MAKNARDIKSMGWSEAREGARELSEEEPQRGRRKSGKEVDTTT